MLYNCVCHGNLAHIYKIPFTCNVSQNHPMTWRWHGIRWKWMQPIACVDVEQQLSVSLTANVLVHGWMTRHTQSMFEIAYMAVSKNLPRVPPKFGILSLLYVRAHFTISQLVGTKPSYFLAPSSFSFSLASWVAQEVWQNFLCHLPSTSLLPLGWHKKFVPRPKDTRTLHPWAKLLVPYYNGGLISFVWFCSMVWIP